MASERHNSNQASASTVNPPNSMMAKMPQPASASFLAAANSAPVALRALHMRVTLMLHSTAAARSPAIIQIAPNQLSGALLTACQLELPPCHPLIEVTMPTVPTVVLQFIRS